ncbi:MAG: thioredoxin domain-containing protein, partial [Chloroflexi bacterium]|nr:thioredoxin domain-containing protein [Chloroflexota bacterium]
MSGNQHRQAGKAGHKQNVRERRRAEQGRRRRLMIGAVVIGLLAVAAFARFAWPRPTPQPVDAARLADDPSLGPSTAPVTIVEYGDFGCPSCRAWHQAGILDRIRAQYGERVRFVWRDFPIITAQSPKAAEAGQCAYDQSKFWEYHDLVYDRAPAIGVSDLKAYAAEIGLEVEKFNQCLDSGQH